MRAIRIHAYGDSSQMQYEVAQLLDCGPSNVLLRVVAAVINPFACAAIVSTSSRGAVLAQLAALADT